MNVYCPGRKEELQSEPKSQGVHFPRPPSTALCQKQRSNQVAYLPSAPSVFLRFLSGHREAMMLKNYIISLRTRLSTSLCDLPCQNLCHLSDMESRR